MGLFNKGQEPINLKEVTIHGNQGYQRKMYADSLSLYNSSIKNADDVAKALAYEIRLENEKSPYYADSNLNAVQKRSYEFYKKALVDPITTGKNSMYGWIEPINEVLEKTGDKNIEELQNTWDTNESNYESAMKGGVTNIERLNERRRLRFQSKINPDIKPTGVLFNVELPAQFVYKEPTGYGLFNESVGTMKPKTIPVTSDEKITMDESISETKKLYTPPTSYRRVYDKEKGWGYIKETKDKYGEVMENEFMTPKEYYDANITHPNYGGSNMHYR